MRKIYIFMFMFILFSSCINAVELTEFTNGKTSEVFRIENNSINVRYITIPKNIYITNASINVNPLNNSNNISTCWQTNPTISNDCGGSSFGSYNYTLNPIPIINPNYIFDGNTLSPATFPGNYGTINFTYISNFTINNNTFLSITYLRTYTGVKIFDNRSYIPNNCIINNSVLFKYSFNASFAPDSGTTIACIDKNSNEIQLYDFTIRGGIIEEFYDARISLGYNSLQNISIGIEENDDSPEFYYDGFYNLSRQFNFSTNINNIVKNCTCSNCIDKNNLCTIPIYFKSIYESNKLFTGYLNISDIYIPYNYSQNLLIYEEGLDVIYTKQNVTIDLIGENNYYSYLTDTGNITINIEPDNYQLTFNSSGFQKNYVYFTQDEYMTSYINLYLLNSTGLTNVTATIYDERGNRLPSSLIKVLEFQDGNFIERQAILSNFEGEAELNLRLNTQYYKFMLYYPATTLREITQPTYIYSTDLTFQIDTQDDVTQNYYDANDIVYSLRYIEQNQDFIFTYTDSNFLGTQYCLYVYDLDIFGKSLVNSSCLTSYSGNINLGIRNESGKTYIAEAYVIISGESYFIDQISYSFVTLNDLKESKYGLFILIVITLVFIFLSKKLIYMALIVPIPLILTSYMQIINLPISYGIAMEILAIIIVIIIKRNE